MANAIAISDDIVESMQALSIESSRVMETPKKTIIKPKYFDTVEKPPRRSLRLQSSAGPINNGKKQPSFVSGYTNGQPIYKAVRVLPQELVSKIEEEIALQEKAEFHTQASEETLFE